MVENCVFCDIVDGEEEAEVIWEDEAHMAFLSNKPNTEGATVVITKDHYTSYAFDLPDNVLSGLTLACKEVGKLLDRSFEEVGRTGMVFEGMGVNHIHAKLFPLHGTEGDWQRIESGSEVNIYYEKYQGYISSHNSNRKSEEQIRQTAEKIRNNK